MQLAYLGHNVYLGNYDACNRPSGFDSDIKKTIHIYHDRQPGHCGDMDIRPDGDLFFEWLEHSPLTVANMERIWQYCLGNDTLFIHCAAGMGRSPQIALLALMARGEHFWHEAVGWIANCTWSQYDIPIIPNWDRKTLEEIVKFLETKK